jgi:translation initiation factor 2 subunit 2
MTACENISFTIQEKKILSEDEIPNISEPDILLDGLFSGQKKKKKKDKLDNQEIPAVQITCEEQEIVDMFNLKLKKRKKDKNDKDKDKDKDKLVLNKYLEVHDPPTYTYETLLNRLYTNFQDENGQIVKTKNTIKLPIIHRFGSKKTGWVNFRDCCNSIDREPTNIINYLINELSTEANVDGNGVLLIKGIYNQKNIENVLRKFVINFVQCSICKSLETRIRKDSAKRINFLECSSCKSSRSLPQIVPGYNKGESKNK